jgi:hypothetical protein
MPSDIMANGIMLSAIRPNGERLYSECHFLSIIIPSVIILSIVVRRAVILSVIIPSVVILTAFILGVHWLNVEAPSIQL